MKKAHFFVSHHMVPNFFFSLAWNPKLRTSQAQSPKFWLLAVQYGIEDAGFALQGNLPTGLCCPSAVHDLNVPVGSFEWFFA